MTTENSKIEIREIINDVPVKFTVYPAGARLGNQAHSLISPATDYTWFVVGEIDTTGMTDAEFFSSPFAVFEGVFWQHSAQTVASHEETLNDVRNMAKRTIAQRMPGSAAAIEAPDSEEVENEIACTVHRIRQYQQKVEEAQARIYDLKDRLEKLLNQRGSNWSDDDGYARLAAPGVRVNYSREALDTLILNDPLQFAWLKQYRKESQVAGRVVVK